MFRRSRRQAAAVLVVTACSGVDTGAAPADGGGKILITTSSDDARKLYLEGRDLREVRGTDARRLFEQAVAKDQSLLWYVGLANTSGTNGEFVDATAHAVALADKVSEGERHVILALDAGMRGDANGNLKHLRTVALFPNDERAHNQLGQLYFGRQGINERDFTLRESDVHQPIFRRPTTRWDAYRFSRSSTMPRRRSRNMRS
jgi:hypothetical protein